MRVFVVMSVILMVWLLPVAYCEGQASNDMIILSQVLRSPNTNGNFTVVAPMTTLSTLTQDDPNILALVKKYVLDKFQAQGEHIGQLFVTLIQRNKNPVKLELTSSPKDGYLIDYDSKFAKYFSDGGGGWKRWHDDNPKALGSTRVSLPAYDPQTGFVLVYKWTQSHQLAGAGYLILYRYIEGKLEELERVMIWIA